VQVIPAIDLERGRSRVVYWPGAAAGIGAPTDRAERIAERFVAMGAPLVHLVDFEGARTGVPGNLEAVSAIAAAAVRISDFFMGHLFSCPPHTVGKTPDMS